MKRIILHIVLLVMTAGILYAQNGLAGQDAGTKDPGALINTEGLTEPSINDLNIDSQVEKSQQQLLEQIEKDQKEEKIKEAEKLKQESLDQKDEDDEDKIINIRSEDFMREISESTKGFYGYDLFYTSRGFKMESSMTAYSDYQIGPGDEIVLAMWGDVELRDKMKVSNEGTIYVNNVGLVSVNGLKLDKLENKLKKLLSKAYITLDPPKGEATTYLDVSLGKLRPITVFLVGEVFKKGAIKLNSYSTVFTALYNAGGPTAKGSLRDIRVVRNGEVVSKIDIYDYLLTGRKVNDVVLKNNDNILIPPRHSSIKLEGEVNNESVYELKEDETMADLIKFSGGLKVTATIDRFQVERVVPFEKRRSDLMHSKEVHEFVLGTAKDGKVRIRDVKLYDGDVVTVFPISNILINYVNIEGPVLLPGKYALKENMTLGDLVNEAGGLLPETYQKKVHITRIMPDLTTKLFDLDLETESSLQFKLESSDNIRVFSIWELKTKNTVRISGHVKKTGRTVLDQGAKISDLIMMAGGLEDKEFRDNTYLERADLIRFNDDGITTRVIPINLREVLEGNVTEDIELKNNDHLKVYDINISVYPESVSIRGAVREPGTFDLQTNMKVEDLILQAGGFEKHAYVYYAEVFRADPFNSKPDSLVSVHKVKINKGNFTAKRGSTESAFKLKDMDIVVIREFPDYQRQRNVKLYGEVKFPGVYSLVKEKETLWEVIERAGGLKSSAFTEGIVFTRDSTEVLSDFDKISKRSVGGKLVLQHGDVIKIPKYPGTVMVEGFVYKPGLVKYQKGWSLSNYIESAGGVMVEDDYEKGETVVFYPGGAAKVDGWFFSPRVKEGSRVVVKRVKKPEEKEGMSLKEWVSVFASVVTISYYLAK